jgi:hypothetical protein
MKHSFYIAFAFLSLIGYLHVADTSIALVLQAQEMVLQEEGEKKPEARAPVHLEKVTIILEGEEVLKQEGIHEWAGKAARIVTEYYPKFDKLLESEGFIPPKEMSIVFRKMEGVAFASGNQIVISADWIRRQPGDFGMVAHELVHVIQNYSGRGQGRAPGWVTEGIADYVRHAHFEPDVLMRPVNPSRIRYTDQYQITAGFFMWIEHVYDKEFVTKLNRHARQRTYSDDLFEKYNGKPLDDLWAEYIKFLRTIGDNPRLLPSEMFGRKKLGTI